MFSLSPSGFTCLGTLSILLAASSARAQVAPPRLANDRLLLTAEQSAGGKILREGDGKLVGVTLDRSCTANFKKSSDAGIEWKLEAPLPAGWWHGIAKSNKRPGYANREFSFVLVSAARASVAMGSNEQEFEFWIYSSSPVESVRIQPSSELWHWNNTWPVSEITLEHRVPATLTASDVITMD
ncbi:MAG: hypothetical protein INR62_06570, partial [Rhodospirillales bacterium]|nr:hypothetical protein [Acetobacter sp.]